MFYWEYIPLRDSSKGPVDMGQKERPVALPTDGGGVVEVRWLWQRVPGGEAVSRARAIDERKFAHHPSGGSSWRRVAA